MLVVDDNEVNLLIAKTTLNQYGISVEAVQSGALALEKLESMDFDIIILDCMMPEMSGHETAQHIRALGGAKAKTPIIAYTANEPDSVREEFADVEVTDVLIKPLETIALTKVLLKYLPNEKLLDKEDVLAELAAIGAAVEVEEPTEKTELQKALEQVPDLDYMTGLHFASDNEENYYNVISTACESMKSIAVNVGFFATQLASGGLAPAGDFVYDSAAFRIDAHSMKGVCACIGMDALSKTSAELERAAIDGMDFSTKIEELCLYSNHLSDAGNSIAVALAGYRSSIKSDVVEFVSMEPEAYKALWDETLEYVRCFAIDEIRQGLEGLFAATADATLRSQLKNAIDASNLFDYSKVSAILKDNKPE